jgi:hypothetical protein
VKKKVEVGKEDLKKKVEDLEKKVQTGREDLEKKVEGGQRAEGCRRSPEEDGRTAEEGRRPRAAELEEVDVRCVREGAREEYQRTFRAYYSYG